MSLAELAANLDTLEPPTAFKFAAEHLPAAWIEEALRATGTASVRRRKLPAEHVVWLAIGMAMFRDRSIAAVVSHLNLARDPADPHGRGASVVRAAIAQARARVGDKPLAFLFEKTAHAWSYADADKHRWRGLAVFAVDGTTMNVADTPANEAYFGRPRNGKGAGGYPQARLVALSVPRTHAIAALAIGPCTTSEPALAAQLWDRVPERSVAILDRGFFSYTKLHILQQGAQRHWLTRAKSNLASANMRPLGEGDALVDLATARHTRKANPGLPDPFTVRAIRYQRNGFRPQTLLTSLLDPKAFPAAEIVALYHERWEIELGFDETKTHMLERKESLRSKMPAGTRQEIWGVAIAYNVVRRMMAEVADAAGVPPRRISFWNSLLAIRMLAYTAWDVAPGMLPTLLRTLQRDLSLMVLPERKARSSPREVKIKMSQYAKKPLRSFANGPAK